MEKLVNIAQARAQFPQIVKQVGAGERIVIGRYGVPVAVLLSYETYLEMQEDIEDLRDAWEAWEEFQKSGGKGIPLDEVLKELEQAE